MFCRRTMLGFAAAALLMTASADAGLHKRGCPTCGPAATCGSRACYVERTVRRVCYVTEMRTCTRTVYRKEMRQQRCTVYQRVPETRTVTKVHTVMVPEVRTRVENYTVRKPVWREEEKTYTVMVPSVEKRQGTRTVCKMEKVTETRTVCVDEGHWEEQCCDDGCDPCAKPRRLCGKRARKVWVPNPVEKEIEVTCCKPVRQEETYEYCVTVCKPEERTCKVRVCDWVEETRQRQCKYTVCVPKQVRRQCQVTTYKCVPRTVVRNVCVRVPCQVTCQVPVRVPRVVCQRVRVPVCAAPACTTKNCGVRAARHVSRGCPGGC